MLERAIKYARRIAYKMSKDPEMDSVAAVAAWKATTSYDGRIPFEAWVATCTKRDVWYYWRKEARHKMDQLEYDVPSTHEEGEELDISREDWRLLVEYYVEKLPLDVLARKYSTSKLRVRRMIQGAVDRLKETLQ